MNLEAEVDVLKAGTPSAAAAGGTAKQGGGPGAGQAPYGSALPMMPGMPGGLPSMMGQPLGTPGGQPPGLSNMPGTMPQTGPGMPGGPPANATAATTGNAWRPPRQRAAATTGNAWWTARHDEAPGQKMGHAQSSTQEQMMNMMHAQEEMQKVMRQKMGGADGEPTRVVRASPASPAPVAVRRRTFFNITASYRKSEANALRIPAPRLSAIRSAGQRRRAKRLRQHPDDKNAVEAMQRALEVLRLQQLTQQRLPRAK